MHTLKTIALCLIALVLSVDFAVDHIAPVIALTAKKQQYLGAARKCHEARSFTQHVRDAANEYDRKLLPTLDRSATVWLMECFQRNNIRSYLLAWGASEDDLDRLDLLARSQSEASLPYFVDGLTSEQ